MSESLRSTYSSRSVTGRFEGGWRFDWRGIQVTPFAAVQASALDTDAYTETRVTGPALFALAFQARTTHSLQSDLGVNLVGDWRAPKAGTVQPLLRLDWTHEFDPDRSVAPSFADLGSDVFVIHGAAAARDQAGVETGLTWIISRGLSAFAVYSGQFGSGSFSDTGTIGLRKVW